MCLAVAILVSGSNGLGNLSEMLDAASISILKEDFRQSDQMSRTAICISDVGKSGEALFKELTGAIKSALS